MFQVISLKNMIIDILKDKFYSKYQKIISSKNFQTYIEL